MLNFKNFFTGLNFFHDLFLNMPINTLTQQPYV